MAERRFMRLRPGICGMGTRLPGAQSVCSEHKSRDLGFLDAPKAHKLAISPASNQWVTSK